MDDTIHDVGKFSSTDTRKGRLYQRTDIVWGVRPE